MKKQKLYSFLVLLLTVIFQVQSQDIPRSSPNASVKQTIGLTEIIIEYSSPAVNGRKIWGGLVPYNELWRTGANMNTTISFSKDVEIEGKSIPAGTYSLFTIPGQNEWTVILNKATNLAGTTGYDQSKDVARFQVKPQEIPMRERFAFVFPDFSMDKGTVALEWEKLRVPFTVNVKTEQQAMESIEKTLKESWRPYTNAARYLLENNKELDKALEYINTSISLNSHWLNNWVKAQILAKQGNYKEALKFAKTAKDLGDKDQNFFFKAQVEQALEEWKKK